MSKLIVLVFCVLALTLARKDHKDQQQSNSIYQPFTDVPVPPTNTLIIEDKEILETEESRKQQKQRQIQQFNEMLGYGLVIGTVILACMLFKTCGNQHNSNSRHQRPAVLQPATNVMPMLNKNIGSADVKNRIQWHKMEIKRLEQEAKHLQEIEQRSQERKRQEQVMRGYYAEVQMHEYQAHPNYCQQFYPQYQHQGAIPVGRPLVQQQVPKDNDSSFASEYPTL